MQIGSREQHHRIVWMQGAREGFSRYPFYLQAAGSSGPICADHSRSREARRAGTRDGVELSLRPFLLRPEGCCRLSPQHLAALSLSLVPGSGLCTDPESLLPTGGCGCREVLSWRASVGLGHGPIGQWVSCVVVRLLGSFGSAESVQSPKSPKATSSRASRSGSV